MRKTPMFLTLMLAAGLARADAPAPGPKPCAELQREIATKLDARGVQGYQLAIVAPEDTGAAKVVGQCEGGTRRITYTREAASPRAAPIAVAGTHSPNG